MTTISRFLGDTGIPSSKLNRVLYLGLLIGRAGMHECNGDYHLRCETGGFTPKPFDENEGVKLWKQDRDEAIAELSGIVCEHGWLVELNGLYPSLIRLTDADGTGETIHLPYRSPQSIVLIGRRWFERTNGNTYFSCEIIVDGELIHKINYEYGYGSQWERSGYQWLRDNGYLESDSTTTLRHHCEDNEIQLVRSCSDVGRKRDL